MEKKNRYVSTLLLILAVFFTTSFLGCSSSSDDDSVTENKYLPNKFSVTIPKSLQKSGASSNMKGAARGLSGRGAESAYATLASDFDLIISVNTTAAMLFVLSDAAINQNGLSPTASSHGTVQVTATQELIDRIKGIIGDIGIDEGEDDPQDYLGQKVALDNFTYASTTETPYNFMVSFSWSMGGSTPDNLKIYWSSDLKKVKYSSISPQGIPEYSLGYLDNEFTYDADLQANAFVIYQKGGEGTAASDIYDALLKVRADGDSGAYVSDYTRDPREGSSQATLLGYGNSAGGIVQDPNGSKYVFDASGALSTSTAYDAKLASATAKLAEIPDLAGVPQ